MINDEDWREVKLIIFLNHTSLFEILFIAIAPNKFLWKIAQNLMLPVAEETLKRPFVGRLIRILIPGCVPISRKNDATWYRFLSKINSQTLTAILPEGRMKRSNGLDKHGNPMSIKPGVVDILEQIPAGNLLFVYSGGLHHIQSPGEKYPRVFKKINAGLEIHGVKAFKAQFNNEQSFKAQVIDDLENKLTGCESL